MRDQSTREIVIEYSGSKRQFLTHHMSMYRVHFGLCYCISFINNFLTVYARPQRHSLIVCNCHTSRKIHMLNYYTV